MSETTKADELPVGMQFATSAALAARISALEAQLTEVTRENASLAPLRAVVEAAKAFMLKWPAVEKASFAAIQMATIHGFPYTGPNVGAELKALADTLATLPADPSAPTPKE